MAIGTAWAVGSWTDAAWAPASWADLGSAIPTELPQSIRLYGGASAAIRV